MFNLNFEGFVTVMAVLGLVIGVIGAFVIFFWFMSKKNEEHFTGRLAKVYDFLHFRFYIIEGILKFCYILMACVCTTMGAFLMISIVEIGKGLLLFTVGNLLVRIVYEFLLMLILACRNLSEINGRIQVWEPENTQKETAVIAIEPDTFVQEAAASEEPAPVSCYCPQCGTKCSTEYTYCNMCGTKLHL